MPSIRFLCSLSLIAAQVRALQWILGPPFVGLLYKGVLETSLFYSQHLTHSCASLWVLSKGLGRGTLLFVSLYVDSSA